MTGRTLHRVWSQIDAAGDMRRRAWAHAASGRGAAADRCASAAARLNRRAFDELLRAMDRAQLKEFSDEASAAFRRNSRAWNARERRVKAAAARIQALGPGSFSFAGEQTTTTPNPETVCGIS